jgi:antitoxin ParD1/3/4
MTERTMTTASLHISLPDTLKEYVNRRVEEGAFSNPSDFVRALIRADREHRQAKLEALRRDIDAGLKDLEEGRVVAGEEVFRQLRERYGEPA